MGFVQHTVSLIMPICIDKSAVATSDGATTDLLSRNVLTTAGVLVGAGTGVAGAAVLVAALPGQMAVAGTLTGGLLYAGHRQHVGKPIIPQFGSDKQTTEPAAETAAA